MEKVRKSIIIAFAVAMTSGCGQGPAENPAVTAAKREHAEFVDTKPETADVIGSYVLTDQTLVPGGMAALGGRQCQLDVLADGTFIVTNYPQIAAHVRAQAFRSLVSATGSWQLATEMTSYGYGPEPKKCWGLHFNSSGVETDVTRILRLVLAAVHRCSAEWRRNDGFGRVTS